MTKKIFVAALLFICSIGFAIPPFPKDKTVERDLKENWKVQGEQGKLLSVSKNGKWEQKLVVEDLMKLQIALIRYTVKVDFKTFVRTFNVNVVYREQDKSWLFHRNVILQDWTDEMAAGTGPTRDEAKAKMIEAFEKEDEQFFKSLDCSDEMTLPVKVLNLKITNPELKNNAYIYYIDIEFETAKSTRLFSKQKKFKYDNMKTDVYIKNDNWKIYFRTLGKCVEIE